MPPIPGAEFGISSDGFFDLTTQPKKCVVIGAGYIAVEMAGILHGLGSESHLAFRGKVRMAIVHIRGYLLTLSLFACQSPPFSQTHLTYLDRPSTRF